MNKLNDTFGPRLRYLRKRKGLTQDQVETGTRIKRATLSSYERGLILPPYDKIQILSEFFGVSIEYLMGESNFENRPEGVAASQVPDVLDVGLYTRKMADAFHDPKTVVAMDGRVMSQEVKDILKPVFETLENLMKLVEV